MRRNLKNTPSSSLASSSGCATYASYASAPQTRTPRICGIFKIAMSFVLSAFVFGSNVSFASELEWRFFPQEQAVEKELLKLIKNGSYSQAALFWTTSLEGERFASTATGRALYAFLIYKSGAPVTGVERLFSVRRAQDVHNTVMSLWKPVLSANPEIAHKSKVAPGKLWAKVLGKDLHAKVSKPPVYVLNSKRSIKELSRLLKVKTEPKRLQDWRRFQLGLAATIQNQHQMAYNQFVRLLESDQTTISKDDLYLALARLEYQQGEFDAAIDWYKKVSKGSDSWLLSKEEQAWAYIRVNEPNEAVAQLETATSPVFTAISGPESDFLNSFVNLMICDYSKVFKITKNFKKKHKKKIVGLETLVKSNNSKLFKKFIALVDRRPIELASFSPVLKSVPRDFILDEFLRRHMEYRQAMVQESKALTKLNKGNVQLANFSSRPSTKDSLEDIYADRQIKAREAEKEISLRLAALAQSELREYKLMIQKLHIVEAEVIQRLHLDENIKGQRTNLENPVAKSSEVMTFPVTKEVWLDELDSYHAEVKDCPKLERASL